VAGGLNPELDLELRMEMEFEMGLYGWDLELELANRLTAAACRCTRSILQFA